jgi:uncharacterized membrane protein YfcA
LDLFTAGVIAAAFLVSGVVKGAVGIGQATTAVALLTTALGLREAVPLLIVPALVANAWQVRQASALGDLLRRFWVLNGAACIGVWLGTLILFAIDPMVLAAVLGVVVCLSAVLNLTRWTMRIEATRERWVSPIAGLVSGILTGTTGSLHLMLVVYFQALGLDKDRFVQACGLTFLIGTVIWAASLAERGALDATAASISALALIPTLLGMAGGSWLRARISEALFRRWVWIGMIVIGLNLIRKALM